MLLHYLGKSKVRICGKSGGKCTENALIFTILLEIGLTVIADNTLEDTVKAKCH